MRDSDAASPSPTPARSPLTQETIVFFRTSNIALDVTKVFADQFGDWRSTASDQGFPRIFPQRKLGIVERRGSLTVRNPAVVHTH